MGRLWIGGVTEAKIMSLLSGLFFWGGKNHFFEY